MEAQNQDPHHDIAAAGDDDQGGEHKNNQQHGEKKSVLKKVKDKAKKIIQKHRHIDDHEHEYRHDQISEEEDDDDVDDEDMVNTPPDQVHGAPMYESPVIAGTNLPIQADVPNVRNEVYPNIIVGDGGVPLERSSVEARRPEFKQTVKISPLIGLEEDPHSPYQSYPGKINPPSNYQCKVTDPTGEVGQEAAVGPLLHRLDNFHIHGQSESNSTAPEQRSFTGSHDQFTPHSTPTVDLFIPESKPVDLSKNPESPKSLDRQAKPESTPRDTIAGKISLATSAIADKAVSTKDMVASKLGYGGGVSSKKPVTELATECEHKAGPEKPTPVYDHQLGGDTEGTDRGVSVKEYLAEKLRPGEEDKALSEAITERFYKKKDEGMHGKEEEVQPVGEVAACFGGSSDGGVVGRLKGAVGSWLGKSIGGHSLGQSHGSVPGVGVEQSKEEIGLQ